MEIAERSLKLLKDMSDTNEDHEMMMAFVAMQIEVEEMRLELKTFKDKMSVEAYKKKKARTDKLSECLELFTNSHFQRMMYKESMYGYKQKLLEKELELLDLTKTLLK